MSASRRQVNNRNSSFTPSGSTVILYQGVTSVAISGGGSILKLSGDGDRFPTTVMNDFSDPTVTVSLNDLASAQSAGIGARGVFSNTYKDARNQTATVGSGDAIINLTTAVIQNIDFSNEHRQYGKYTIMFAAESADGLTSPLSLTITP